MRIAFVNPSRETFRSTSGRVCVGRADENDLTVDVAGVADRHLVITEDRRGLVLEVLPGAQHLYVNARPVRERALLRYGDVLSVGGCKLTVLPDIDPVERASLLPLIREAAPRPGFAALRAVAGLWSGRLLPVEERLVLGGRDFALPDRKPCELSLCDRGVRLIAGDIPVAVNGIQCRDALLAPGDQLTMGEHRFVLEAPGLQAAAIGAREAPQALPVPAPLKSRASRAESWWLLGTAALLAVVIAALLWWRH